MNIEFGLCQCGCGGKTTIATRNKHSCGILKGQPHRFIASHTSRFDGRPLEEKFWARLPEGPGCRLWTGPLNGQGYGRFIYGGRQLMAHRVAWELTNGPIPDGQDACHTCDKDYPLGDITYRRCGEPTHLFLGTQADNIADMCAKGRQAVGDRNGTRIHPERRPRGSKHGMAKLTASQVAEIRDRYADRGISQRVLASEYGIHQSHLSAIVRGARWGTP